MPCCLYYSYLCYTENKKAYFEAVQKEPLVMEILCLSLLTATQYSVIKVEEFQWQLQFYWLLQQMTAAHT